MDDLFNILYPLLVVALFLGAGCSKPKEPITLEELHQETVEILIQSAQTLEEGE